MAQALKAKYSSLASVVPVKVEKPDYRYIYYVDLMSFRDLCDKHYNGASTPVKAWFENNGFSFMQEVEENWSKGKVKVQRFLYMFDMNKLREDMLEQLPLTSKQVEKILGELSKSKYSTKKEPENIKSAPHDGTVPGMQEKDDGIRQV